MLTPTQFVQQTASSLWPFLLLLIAWYAFAVALRALSDMFLRLVQKQRVQKALRKIERPSIQLPQETAREQVFALEKYMTQLELHLEQTMLRSQRADSWHLTLLLIESTLFLMLACGMIVLLEQSFFRLVWWFHLVGIAFFLCFLVRSRRFFLLFPLGAMAWFSWEIFSFIGGFERTLQATSQMAKIHIIDQQQGKTGSFFMVKMTFPNQVKHTFRLRAHQKLYFEGTVMRVSSDVLLFGGKNLASVQRVFSDVLPP
ncbi:MAG: hypothetical protein AAGJ35_14050, partial [Myxococcota bacterium]